jgi:hypothetical protein
MQVVLVVQKNLIMGPDLTLTHQVTLLLPQSHQKYQLMLKMLAGEYFLRWL